MATAVLGGMVVLSPRPAEAQALCPPGVSSGSLRLMTYNASLQVGAPDGWSILTAVLTGQGAFASTTDPSATYGMADDARIDEIVARIIKDDPDVFALQEVNKGAAKDAFIKKLRDAFPNGGGFPHFVRNVGSHADVELNNSGLMLFSKFRIIQIDSAFRPIGPPPSPSNPGYADIFVNGTLNEDADHNTLANTVIYGDAASPDSWASKGVTVVKIEHECNGGQPFTVAFTHMQATYPDDNPFDRGYQNQVRLQQFEDVKFALSGSMSANEMQSTPVFVLGDLNVNGMPNAPNTFTAENGVLVEESHSEWAQTFTGVPPATGTNPSGVFFACGAGNCTFDKNTNPGGTFLVDGWGFGMPSTDPGPTSSGGTAVGGNWLALGPGEGERIDYVLHNRPVSEAGVPLLCLQYMKRGLEYFSSAPDDPAEDPPSKAAGVELSDHIPVLADFNRPAPRCSPFPLAQPFDRGPKSLLWDPEGSADIVMNDAQTIITHPGSMQWYHITQAGTYTIETAPTVNFEVYADTNLSVPVTPAEACEDVEGKGASRKCKFSMLAPPYFVRVFRSNAAGAPDRFSKGPYQITFHQCRCSSPADSCLLPPATPYPVTWPQALLQPEDTMYFEIETEHTVNGTPPLNSFTMTLGQAPPVSLFHSVAEADGVTVVPSDPTGAFGPLPPPLPWFKSMRTMAGAMPGADGLPLEYFYKVHRDSPGESFPMTVEFNTSLTYLLPRTLTCIEERTIIGDDDVWGHFVSDPSGGPPMSCGNTNPDCVFIGWMNTADDGGPSTPRAITDGRLFKSYSTKLNPQIWEDVWDTGDDFLFAHDPDFIDALDRGDVGGDAESHRYQNDASPGHYHYEMSYSRSHVKPSCRPSKNAPAYVDFCPSTMECSSDGLCQ